MRIQLREREKYKPKTKNRDTVATVEEKKTADKLETEKRSKRGVSKQAREKGTRGTNIGNGITGDWTGKQ